MVVSFASTSNSREAIGLTQGHSFFHRLPATMFGIRDRGFLRRGAYADVVVFDAKMIRDTATYQEPHSYSEGMEYVLVNGQPAVAEGQVVPKRFRRLLLKER